MATITIRNLEPSVKRGLRVRAARHGVSMEEEARGILRSAVQQELEPPRNLAEAIRALFAPLGGVGVKIPARQPMREPPKIR
jgi:plasmid stability protein